MNINKIAMLINEDISFRAGILAEDEAQGNVYADEWFEDTNYDINYVVGRVNGLINNIVYRVEELDYRLRFQNDGRRPAWHLHHISQGMCAALYAWINIGAICNSIQADDNDYDNSVRGIISEIETAIGGVTAVYNAITTPGLQPTDDQKDIHNIAFELAYEFCDLISTIATIFDRVFANILAGGDYQSINQMLLKMH